VQWKIHRESEIEIIVPTKDKVGYLSRCIDSIITSKCYSKYKILIVDTGSLKKATKKYYDTLKDEKRIRVIDYPHQYFNYSSVNNWASCQTNASFLLFMNNDTEIIDDEWLDCLMEYGLQSKVGIVGPKMVYPNNSIQHMGVVIGIRNGAAHIGARFPDARPMGYPFFQAKDIARNVSAVTGACLLIKKSNFEMVHGFDERFRLAFNDLDLCMKIRNIGKEIIYTPFAKIIHHEGVSLGRPIKGGVRSMSEYEKEREQFNSIWGHTIPKDPYYNSNLTLRDESITLKKNKGNEICPIVISPKWEKK